VGVRILNGELWPYRVTIEEPDYWNAGDVEIWLDQNVGVFREQWNAVYYYKYSDFYFREARDATLFSLRWT
jgi:hypothetical protein